jgi:chemotaxis protein MotB
MAKKQKKTECPAGAPMWMTSYADMVTLILVFFVLMYSFAVLDIAKFADFAASFRRNLDTSFVDLTGSRGITEMLGNGITEFPTVSTATSVMNEMESEREQALANYRHELTQMFASPFENLFDHLDGMDVGFAPHFWLDPDDLTISITLDSRMLFAPGQWELNRESRAFLGEVADRISRAFMPGDMIVIEGHTDNVPMSPRNGVRDNWDLSSQRANSVRSELQRLTGLPGNVFKAVGMGEYHPVDPLIDNNLPDNRARNRRVVILIEASAAVDIEARLAALQTEDYENNNY